MTNVVSSYIADEWVTPDGEHAVIQDSSTGREVAQVSTTGGDMHRLVVHARSVGGPALRSMTFPQRGRALLKLAEHLTSIKGELYADSAQSGATLQDARFDVDGGINVLEVYGKKVARALPDDTVYVEQGAPQTLGRNSTFVGQTIYTSRHGVAVFINAYNFPVWGMLEKLAPAVLAGLPMIVKPATATAQIAARAFRGIIDSGALPPGAIQLIAGPVGDLLEHLDGQDSVAFTGSADTAAQLRTNPAITSRGVRFNVEADSVNASILGPDAGPDTEEFQLYIKNVQREMTLKAGQKCTAIRRCLVPVDLVEAVIDALRQSLAPLPVGDPRSEGTRVGPLVNVRQRDEVIAATQRLMKSADVVIGGLSLASGDADHGAFFPPTLLLARDAQIPELHQVEAFGPVATIFPYHDAHEALELAARGGGSLVASVVSHDPRFVREMVIGLAPFHGRILVLDRDDASEAPPHGAVIPQLIHGGPGRAGGGEELGGLRAVLHQMQATSVSGSPAVLTMVTKRWNAAAPQLTTAGHPFRRYFDELQLGETLITGTRTITVEDIESFAALTGDTFYAHMDPEAAAASPLFTGRVAHGYFVVAAAAGLFVEPAPGPVLANTGLDNLRFTTPVYPGDVLQVRLTCKEKTPKNEQHGEVRWDVAVTNQDSVQVAGYDVLTLNAVQPKT